jgi:hypothetical protein
MTCIPCNHAPAAPFGTYARVCIERFRNACATPLWTFVHIKKHLCAVDPEAK